MYDLMKAEGVDFVVQNGDFDYLESPLTWENFLLARNLEVLVTSGNHEEQSFYNYKWVCNTRLLLSSLRTKNIENTIFMFLQRSKR